MAGRFFIKTSAWALASLFWLAAEAAAAEPGGLEPVGRRELPSFTFAASDGKAHALDEYRGRVVLLNFWATWCGPCVKEMPSLDALQATYGPRGLSVLPVSRDATGMLTVKTWLRQHKLAHLPPLWDEGSRGARALGISALPTSYLIGRDGRVIAATQGGLDWMGPPARAAVEKALDEAKAEEQARR